MSAVDSLEEATDVSLFSLFNDWLAMWFDGNNHSLGKNTILFPKVNRAFGHRPWASPFCEFNPGTDAEIRIVMFPLPIIPDSNDKMANNSVSSSVFFNFWISAKEPHDKQSEKLADRIATLLKKILTNSESSNFLVKHGVILLQPQLPQKLPIARYEKRLLACRIELSKPIQFDLSFKLPSRERPKISPVIQKSLEVKPGFEKAHDEWLKLGGENIRFRYSHGPQPEFYKTAYWKRVREAILQRDFNKCLRCEKNAGHVHHLHYLHRGHDHFYPESLVSVCQHCHVQVEFARLAQSRLHTYKYRLNCVRGRIANNPKYADETPIKSLSRLLEYRIRLEKLREGYEQAKNISFAEFKTFNPSDLPDSNQKAGIEPKAKEILESWNLTEKEQSERILGMVEDDMKRCAEFISEVLGPLISFSKNS